MALSKIYKKKLASTKKKMSVPKKKCYKLERSFNETSSDTDLNLVKASDSKFEEFNNNEFFGCLEIYNQSKTLRLGTLNNVHGHVVFYFFF